MENPIQLDDLGNLGVPRLETSMYQRQCGYGMPLSARTGGTGRSIQSVSILSMEAGPTTFDKCRHTWMIEVSKSGYLHVSICLYCTEGMMEGL